MTPAAPGGHCRGVMRAQAEGAPLRVMIVDDYELVRDGLVSMLSEATGIEVVAEAGTADEAVARAELYRPDVVVMDVRLGKGDGIQATREIRSRLPDARVLMLTSFADDDAVFAALMAGASGYVLKEIRMGALLKAIRAVGAGQNLMDSAANQEVLARFKRGKRLVSDPRLARLSPQEEKVLELIADGLTNRQIGEALELSEKTVKNYLSNILMKLEVERRAEAAAYLARRQGKQG
jgi:two-component system response regulator DevR